MGQVCVTLWMLWFYFLSISKHILQGYAKNSLNGMKNHPAIKIESLNRSTIIIIGVKIMSDELTDELGHPLPKFKLIPLHKLVQHKKYDDGTERESWEFKITFVEERE